MQTLRACVFCAAAPTTKEDLFPKWIGRYLGRQRTVSRFGSGGSSGRTAIYHTFTGMSYAAKAKVVCQGCNGGWMKGLEDAVAPTMKRMFDGYPAIQLPAGDDITRRALSEWAMKTALMLQFQGRGSAVPPPVYQDFYASKQPPPHCQIYLASHILERMPNGAHSISWDVSAGSPPPAGVVHKGQMYGVTFFVSNVVLQVIGLYPLPPRGVGLDIKFPQTFAGYVQRLWPAGYPVAWPFTPSLSDAQLVRFGTELTKIRH